MPGPQMTTETSAPTSAPAELDADHGAMPVGQRRPGRGRLLLGVLLALCGAMAVVAAGLILRGGRTGRRGESRCSATGVTIRRPANAGRPLSGVRADGLGADAAER